MMYLRRVPLPVEGSARPRGRVAARWAGALRRTQRATLASREGERVEQRSPASQNKAERAQLLDHPAGTVHAWRRGRRLRHRSPIHLAHSTTWVASIVPGLALRLLLVRRYRKSARDSRREAGADCQLGSKPMPPRSRSINRMMSMSPNVPRRLAQTLRELRPKADEALSGLLRAV